MTRQVGPGVAMPTAPTFQESCWEALGVKGDFCQEEGRGTGTFSQKVANLGCRNEMNEQGPRNTLKLPPNTMRYSQ